MAPPLPPPGVPPRAGFAPRPTAELPVSTLLRTRQDTAMLLSAAPFEHPPPSNVLPTTYTGSPFDWLSTRSAAPPRSGPVRSQRLPTKRELITAKRPPWTKIAPPPPPPWTKIAPPPPPSAVWPVLSPFLKTRFCTVSRGLSWSWQCDVVKP